MCELIEETIIMEDISNACILSKLLGSMISFLFFSVSNFVNESDAREEITTPDSSIAFWVNRYYQVFCQVILQSKYTTSLMQLCSEQYVSVWWRKDGGDPDLFDFLLKLKNF